MSSGEKKRVSFAKVLLCKDDVILIDELTSSVHPKYKEEIFQRLKVMSENKLVIIVSHELHLANKYGDEIINLDEKSKYCTTSIDLIEYDESYSLINQRKRTLSSKMNLLIYKSLIKRNLPLHLFTTVLYTITFVLIFFVLNSLMFSKGIEEFSFLAQRNYPFVEIKSNVDSEIRKEHELYFKNKLSNVQDFLLVSCHIKDTKVTIKRFIVDDTWNDGEICVSDYFAYYLIKE